jgi:putative ABC transport system permease protein
MIAVIWSAAAVGVGALRENPLRTLLSTLGVIIGVASLVAVLSLGDALQAFARNEIDRQTDVQSIAVEARTWHVVDGRWEPVRNVLRLTTEDFEQLAAALPESKGAWMSRSGTARVAARRTSRERTAGIQAVSAGIGVTGRPRLAAGRLFTEREDRGNAPVVILSWKLAEELANGRPATSMLGEEVRVGSLPREVIGIFEGTVGERGYSARIPLAGAATTIPQAMSGAASITLRARSLEDVPSLKSSIQDWLARRYRGWEDRVELVVAEDRLADVNRGFFILKLFLGALAGISMLVGGIGIMNIMLASVTERTREIGIRKAIGANRRDIRLQFLTEAVAISFVGSGAGVVIGLIVATIAVAVMRSLAKAEGLGVSFTPGTLLLSAGIAVAVGLVFGTYPARRASRLSPIDAIRHE